MKKRSFALAAAFMLALALTGCSADRERGTPDPSHSVAGDHSGVNETDGGNDAFKGGGAGGTNDRDNDGRPDSGIGSDGQSGVGQAVDDIGRDVNDAIHDAGDAIGDAVNDVGRDMR